MRFRGGGVGHIYMRYIEPWLDGTGWGKSWPSLGDREPGADQDPSSKEIGGTCAGKPFSPSQNNHINQDREDSGDSEDSDDDILIDNPEDDIEQDPEQPEEENRDEEEVGYEGEEEEEHVKHPDESESEAGDSDTDVSDSGEEDHYL